MAKVSRGKLSTPIKILRKGAAQDEYGAVIDSVDEVATVFCEWLPVSATAATQSAADGMNVSTKLHLDINTDIRYADKVFCISTSITYEVVSVMPVPADNKKIVLIGVRYV